jgi:hypothetical protein
MPQEQHQSRPPSRLREWCEREYGSYRGGLIAIAIAVAGLVGFIAVVLIAVFSALS